MSELTQSHFIGVSSAFIFRGRPRRQALNSVLDKGVTAIRRITKNENCHPFRMPKFSWCLGVGKYKKCFAFFFSRSGSGHEAFFNISRFLFLPSSSSPCRVSSTDIPDTLTPLFLTFIASGRSSGLHPVSSHSCWMYVRAGRPAFARPYVGVHRSTSLMSSSLLLQQCPACLVRLTWIDGRKVAV